MILASLLAAFIALVSPIVGSAASEYCAFEVRVTNPSGRPVAGVAVAIITADNKEFSGEILTDRDGRARLCDAPMQPVTIIAGTDVCGLVAVKNISPIWPSTEHVFITFEPKSCNHFPRPGPCTVLLRIVDEEDRPISNAAWRGQAPGAPALSDRFGRVIESVRDGGELVGTVSKEGYFPTKATASCSKDSERRMEKKIRMQRVQ